MLLREATENGIALPFSPWLRIPGIPVVLAVLCWTLVGNGLRDAFDP